MIEKLTYEELLTVLKYRGEHIAKLEAELAREQQVSLLLATEIVQATQPTPETADDWNTTVHQIVEDMREQVGHDS